MDFRQSTGHIAFFCSTVPNISSARLEHCRLKLSEGLLFRYLVAEDIVSLAEVKHMDSSCSFCFLQHNGWVHKKYTERKKEREIGRSNITFYNLIASEVMQYYFCHIILAEAVMMLCPVSSRIRSTNITFQ